MEAFVFIRRTPRALNFHAAISRPMNVRKAGTQQRTIQWREMAANHELEAIARGVISSIRRRTDRRTLEVDLATVADCARFEGYRLEHMPESPMFRECIRITKEAV